MCKVAVIMSTYNGEKFLREQLDSILMQEGVDVTLFVRDDGSTDGTSAILTEYATIYGNVKVSFEKNVGVANSFMNALYAVPDTFDYYAFSDQDDIWYSNKLTEAISQLLSSGKLLYASNQENTDVAGISLGLRYAPDADIHLTPISIISRNMLAGCTMVFTRELFLRLTEKPNRPSADVLENRMHDVWVAAVASVYGGISYDTRSFMKYRQHANNAVGANDGGFKKSVKIKVKKIFSKKLRNGRSFLASELIGKFDCAKKYPYVQELARARKIWLIKHSRELRGYTGESKTSFLIKVAFGLI